LFASECCQLFVRDPGPIELVVGTCMKCTPVKTPSDALRVFFAADSTSFLSTISIAPIDNVAIPEVVGQTSHCRRCF